MALFSTGQLVVTLSVHELIAENAAFGAYVWASVFRHIKGDWGEMDAEDKETNDQALKSGDRLFSSYTDDRFPKNGVATIWIITEADRSSTTVLFPDEY